VEPVVLALWRLGRVGWSRAAGRARRRPRAGQPAALLPSLQFVHGRDGRKPAPRCPAAWADRAAAVAHLAELV